MTTVTRERPREGGDRTTKDSNEGEDSERRTKEIHERERVEKTIVRQQNDRV